MVEPTLEFRPFGDSGPKVLLFGKQTGDWNMSCFSPPGNYLHSPGLYSRINWIASKNYVSEICTPNPAGCNAILCSFRDHTFRVQREANSVILNRGIEADGMVLHRGQSGALATADCPTIVAFLPASGIVIMAHAGMQSLMNGVIDSVMKAVYKNSSAVGMRVFITCGIAGSNYERRDMAQSLPKECLVDGTRVDLRKLACTKFQAYGVKNITGDLVDTFGDRNNGNHLWHSYRRDRTPTRNLVLVVNK